MSTRGATDGSTTASNDEVRTAILALAFLPPLYIFVGVVAELSMPMAAELSARLRFVGVADAKAEAGVADPTAAMVSERHAALAVAGMDTISSTRSAAANRINHS